MNTLFAPFPLGNKTTLKNRFVKSAMSEQLGDKNHNPKKSLATVYKKWAEGGTGLLMSGNIMIDRDHLGEPANVVLDEKSDLDSFLPWTNSVKTHDCQIWAQLNHPGKQTPSFILDKPKSSSAVPLSGPLAAGFNPPEAMTDEEVRQAIKQFATSSKLAKQVGFSGVQLHGAHGYLINQFLSPYHNHRDDHWGGTEDKRFNFALEVIKAIRTEVGEDYPVGIKLNSGDFMKEGLSEDDSIAIVHRLVEAGIDLVEVSGGSYEAPVMMDGEEGKPENPREAYFLNYAEKLRKTSDVALVVTGGFRTASAMASAIDSGHTDMIGLARGLCLHTDIPNQIENNADFTVEFTVPSTGFQKLDLMLMLGVTWFEHQIARMAKSKKPKANLSAWSTAYFNFRHMGMYIFRPRRDG